MSEIEAGNKLRVMLAHLCRTSSVPVDVQITALVLVLADRCAMELSIGRTPTPAEVQVFTTSLERTLRDEILCRCA